MPLANEATSRQRSEQIAKAFEAEFTPLEMACLTGELIKLRMLFFLGKGKINQAFGNPKTLSHQLTVTVFNTINFPISTNAYKKLIDLSPGEQIIPVSSLPDEIIYLLFPGYQHYINCASLKDGPQGVKLNQQFLTEVFSAFEDIIAYTITENKQNAMQLLISYQLIFNELRKKQDDLIAKLDNLYHSSTSFTTSSIDIFNKEKHIIYCYTTAVTEFNNKLNTAREIVWSEFSHIKTVFTQLQQSFDPKSPEYETVIQTLKFMASFSKCNDLKSIETKRKRFIVRINNATKSFNHIKDEKLAPLLWALNTLVAYLPKDRNSDKNLPKDKTKKQRQAHLKREISVPNPVNSENISHRRKSSPTSKSVQFIENPEKPIVFSKEAASLNSNLSTTSDTSNSHRAFGRGDTINPDKSRRNSPVEKDPTKEIHSLPAKTSQQNVPQLTENFEKLKINNQNQSNINSDQLHNSVRKKSNF